MKPGGSSADVVAEHVTGRGVRGVVSAAAPLAAARGAEVMRSGGNSYDAAVTAALAEAVLLPPKCGLGGDLVALRLRAGESKPEALLAIGPACTGLAATLDSLGVLPETGPLSVGPPGAPAGYAALASEGRLPLEELARPAIEMARTGFVWSSICTALTRESKGLLDKHQPSGCVYLPNGHPHGTGDLVTLPGLANCLEEFAARGAGIFGGPVGDALVRRVTETGGVLTMEDLRQSSAEWVPAISRIVGGWRVWATPAPTYGPALLDTLEETTGQRESLDVWQAFRRATERRRKRLGDIRAEGTSIVTAAEAGGDVVVILHSNSYSRFGSGLIVEDYDLILNNRAGRGFTAIPGHPNAPRLGRRPATTLHAWAIGRADRPLFLGGTPGGENQVAWNAQTLSEILLGEEHPGRLVTNPRWEWLPAIDGLAMEDGLSEEVRAGLRHDAGENKSRTVGQLTVRSAQHIVEVPTTKAIVAAADPRTGGAVVPV
ncbi:MAG: gamma-glutamyltransferase [Gammaproteobacteria bacterium]